MQRPELNIIIGTQYNPYLNLSIENHLLNTNPKNTVTIFLWKNHHTVVIGANQNPYAECNVEALRGDGGLIARRKSGGGAVYHDLGNLNFSFIVNNKDYDVKKQLSIIQKALLNYNLVAEISGRNDITINGRKFSGNAFCNTKSNSLHHGTILIKTDVEKISKYLTVKPVKLMKHGVKSVSSRVVNLSELAEITAESLIPHIISAAEQVYGAGAMLKNFDTVINDDVINLSEEFASDTFLYDKWQHFNAKRSAQFDWGNVEIDLAIENNTFIDINIATDCLNLEAIDHAKQMLLGCRTISIPTIYIDNKNIIQDIFELIYS